jgi:hypothetical protein
VAPEGYTIANFDSGGNRRGPRFKVLILKELLIWGGKEYGEIGEEKRLEHVKVWLVSADLPGSGNLAGL